MKVILYIGHHKVGSTALQTFLAQNWHRLIQAGILYPAVESRGFASTLARALSGKDRAGEVDVNIREPHSALAYKMMAEVSEHRKVPGQFRRLPASPQMLLAIQNQIRFLKPQTVILCSEAFANFGQVRPALIETLTGIFPDAEFEVYCALRRPDDYLISWHGQRLKVGETLPSLRDGGAVSYYDNIHFNFRTVVESWADLVPGVRLMLRPYDAILAAGGSTQDFMIQAGADFPDGLIPAGRANPSLPRAAMEIARRGNHELPPEPAQALRQHLLDLPAEQVPVPNRDVEMFGAALRGELAERFAPIHAYLSERIGQPAFFRDLAELSRPRPVPEAEAVAALLERLAARPPADPALASYLDSLRRDYAA